MSKQNVIQFLDKNEEQMISQLKKLISINSENPGPDVPGNKELEIQEYLAKELEEIGFSVDKFAVDEAGVRPNVVGVLHGNRKGKSKDIIFNAHVDTVVVSERDKWTVDPFLASEKDGLIYGRGANDMKGGLTAALWAAKAIKQSGVELGGDVILVFSAGEESCEGGTIGAAACIKRGYRAQAAVICEPTNVEIHNGTASLLCFELIIQGKAIHTCFRNQVVFPQSRYQKSGDEVGVDAVEKALPFMQFFYKLEKDWNLRWKTSNAGTGGRPGHDRQGIGVFNINPSFVQAGTYIAAVAGEMKLQYCVWHPPEIDAEEIMEEIRSHVHNIAQTDDWLRKNPPVVNVIPMKNPI